MTIQLKDIEEYFFAALFIMLYKVVHSFEAVIQIRLRVKTKTFWEVLSLGDVRIFPCFGPMVVSFK